MKYLALLAALIAAPAGAQDIPGLVSARLLPGWIDAAGTRFSALEVVLEPGWKTYWRSPGDSGIPPRLDWQGDPGQVEMFWPAPQVFEAGGARSVGYHDRLVLPFAVTPEADGAADALRAEVELGLCREVCVPVSITLTAPEGGDDPDPQILAAMAAQPVAGDPGLIRCAVDEISDGLRITAHLPADMGHEVVAEVADPSVWVSEPEIGTEGAQLTAVFEAVAPLGKPFPLTGEAIRITVLGPQAVEFAACPLAGS